jgi:hypothetical protein
MTEEQVNGTTTPTEEVAGETPEDLRAALNRFMEHQRRAFDEAGKALDALVPDGFKEHGSEARREFIQGFKLLVDTAIRELEKASREFDRARKTEASAEAAPSTTGKTKVKVQVE